MSNLFAEPNDTKLLDEVLHAYTKIENPRLRELVLSAATHIHKFVEDTSLTREEWEAGLLFLTAVGQASREGRQESILLSDLLGLSTAVDQVSYNAADGDTPSSVEGPYFIKGSPLIPFGGSIIIDKMDAGDTALIQGQIKNRKGECISRAIVDIWQTAPNKLYAAADPDQSEFNLRGVQKSNENGLYAFETFKPVPYSVPTDGPAGILIKLAKGHGMRAAHIHMSISATGYKTLITQICIAGDPYLQSDSAFSIVAPLIVEFKQPSSSSKDPRLVAKFNIVLQDE